MLSEQVLRIAVARALAFVGVVVYDVQSPAHRLRTASAEQQRERGGAVSANGSTPLLISVPEAARLLSIGRNTCYELIAAERLPSVKLGRRRLVSRAALEAWITQECGVASPPDVVVPFGATGPKEQ